VGWDLSLQYRCICFPQYLKIWSIKWIFIFPKDMINNVSKISSKVTIISEHYSFSIKIAEWITLKAIIQKSSFITIITESNKSYRTRNLNTLLLNITCQVGIQQSELETKIQWNYTRTNFNYLHISVPYSCILTIAGIFFLVSVTCGDERT
jgi:hypothetical protein